jgi:DNA-binding XRE family transcriptional regulator
MAKFKLESINSHLNTKLKNKRFQKAYELERAKVALAQRIAEIREQNQLTQAELARKLQVSQQFISQIETAQANNLTLDVLIKIAHSLGKGVKISFPKLSKQSPPLVVN